ncbi:hypothetical protein ILYODFUR_030830, partial [Ilyodon furcidens]
MEVYQDIHVTDVGWVTGTRRNSFLKTLRKQGGSENNFSFQGKTLVLPLDTRKTTDAQWPPEVHSFCCRFSAYHLTKSCSLFIIGKPASSPQK